MIKKRLLCFILALAFSEAVFIAVLVSVLFDSASNSYRYSNYMSICDVSSSTEDIRETTKKQEETAPVQNKLTQTISGVVTIEEGADVSEDFIQAINDKYNLLPIHIRERFENNSGEVVISSTDLGVELGRRNNTVLAYCIPERHYIKLDNRSKAKSSVLHEMGHIMDYQLGWVSKSDEFTSIYNSEVEIFKSIWNTDSQNTSNSTEYLGESFLVYITNPNLLKDSCPETYNFLVDFVENLKYKS